MSRRKSAILGALLVFFAGMAVVLTIHAFETREATRAADTP